MSAGKRYCMECGEGYVAATTRSKFCCLPCNKTFNNRRSMRGAILYDLFMALRFERGLADKLNLWTLVCRQCMFWKMADENTRGDRNTWRAPSEVIAERPYLHSITGRI